MLTDQYIAELINCEKAIVGSVPRPQRVNRHWQSTAHLERSDGVASAAFSLFLRQSVFLEENFSVGLVLKGEGGCILLRYNGPHQPHRNPDGTVLPSGPHIHMAKQEMIAAGMRADRYAETTEDYYTFPEAQIALLSKANVHGWQPYFPWLTQERLFPEDDGNAH